MNDNVVLLPAGVEQYANLRREAEKLLRASLEVLALCTYKGDIDRNFIKDRELIDALGDAADDMAELLEQKP